LVLLSIFQGKFEATGYKPLADSREPVAFLPLSEINPSDVLCKILTFVFLHGK
jgi:hypothetical protein